MKLSIVIPAYNEVGTIEDILGRVDSIPYEKEIIVVDDGSTDGTAQRLNEIATTKDIKTVFHGNEKCRFGHGVFHGDVLHDIIGQPRFKRADGGRVAAEYFVGKSINLE